MSDPDWGAFLGTVPLLEGLSEAELAELAHIMRPRTLAEGEVLWHEGQHAKSMVLIVDGNVSVAKRLPGDRAVEVAGLGPREALGEIPLVDGGEHSATVRATEATTVLALSRPDLAALVSRRHPSAFALKRRVATVATQRLRQTFGSLAASLGEELGLYRDAESKFSALAAQLSCAAGLVVDTGLNALGWSADQAHEFLRSQVPMDEPTARNTIDRELALPGEALACALGARTFQNLRARARETLGGRFDIRAYHAEILDGGAMPLDLLDQRVSAWIAQQKAGAALPQ